MDQRKPRPIYRSKGVPAKITNTYMILGIIMALAGIVMVFLPLFTDAPKAFVFMGFVYLAIALLCPRFYFQMKRCRLYVFDDHIVGVSAFRNPANSTNPFAGRKTANADVKFKFYLDEITNVEKGVAMYSQVIITANEQKYSVVVKNRDKAYNLLCDLVFGAQGARECVACGAPIGATAEVCAHCGQMTRYGHSRSEVKASEKETNTAMIGNAIAIVVGIVGLFLLIPALIDFNKIRTYGELYTAFYPEESKKIIFKLFAGLFMSVFGFSYPFSSILTKKILKK